MRRHHKVESFYKEINRWKEINLIGKEHVMAAKRRLLMGGVDLVKTRLKNASTAMLAVCDELDPILEKSGFFVNAPFECISLILRYGLVNKIDPEYQSIDHRHSELPISVELDANLLQSLDRSDPVRLRDLLSLVATAALLDVSAKFGLASDSLRAKKKDLIGRLGSTADIGKDTENLMHLAGHTGDHSGAYYDLVQRLLSDGWKTVENGEQTAAEAYKGVCRTLREGITDGTIRPYNSKDVIPAPMP